MKSLIEFWTTMADELAIMCHASTTRDVKTLTSRVEHEGISFLTISLPSFASDFQKSLETGKVDHDAFLGFKRTRGLPRFLGGFLDRVFDRGSGRLLDEPCVDSIFAIRQLTLVFAKISLQCTPARERAAMRKFIECEQEVRASDRSMTDELRQEFHRSSLVAFGDIFDKLNRDVEHGDLIPRHGPGRTADRLRGNTKYDQSEWTLRLERVFPYGDHALVNWRYRYRVDRVDFLEPGRERPVRVVSVPKTLKTPRIIAIEPTCMQFMQQAISTRLTEYIAKDPILGSQIGFSDQVPNQILAKKGSLGHGLATIDLSEASDRVSNQHVRTMVKSWPSLQEALDSTRSRKADVPGHGVIRLAKYASMGSALCFPIEAMTFYVIVMMAVHRVHRRRMTRRSLKGYAGKVRIYGDDIIVPEDCVETVIEYLHAFGMKVNLDKTFWRGNFRESCGRDYYAGTDVTTVRVRHIFPRSRSQVPEVISQVSLRNQLYYAGLWKTASWLDERISRVLRGKFPVVHPTSSVLGRHSFLPYEGERDHPHYHSPLVRGYVVSSKIPRSGVSGEGALLKCLLKQGDEPFADRRHLERAGRPDAVDIKLRWASPF